MIRKLIPGGLGQNSAIFRHVGEGFVVRALSKMARRPFQAVPGQVIFCVPVHDFPILRTHWDTDIIQNQNRCIILYIYIGNLWEFWKEYQIIFTH